MSIAKMRSEIRCLCRKYDELSERISNLESGIVQDPDQDIPDQDDGDPFVENDNLNVTFFNEQQFAFGFGFQNTTNATISEWTAQIANANYELDETQLTNNGAFDLVTTNNPDGTFTHTFIGQIDIPPFSALPGGAIQANGVDLGVTPTSDGLVTGTGGA